tara:strand:+ start:474 stop:950 length:477 start_codon:yes stop_codon:yes gene_type:complete
MSPPNYLNLTIFPHRSLSKKGFHLLMFLVAFICLTGGMIFWYLGAWPVFGFLGLDILLIYGAFKLNYRSGSMYERLYIISKKLKILRSLPSGKVQIWELNPYWAEANIVKINRNQSQLIIKSKGKAVSVGSFLNSYDKKKLEKKISYSLKNYKESVSI